MVRVRGRKVGIGEGAVLGVTLIGGFDPRPRSNPLNLSAICGIFRVNDACRVVPAVKGSASLNPA